MGTAHVATNRRRLRWAIAASAAIPTLTGVREILQGASGAPGGAGTTSATIDGELRYANVFKAFVGPVVWSNLDDVETSPAVTAALSAIVIGGGARLLSWQQRGKPHPVAVVAIGLETVVLPALLMWRRQVAAQSR